MEDVFWALRINWNGDREDWKCRQAEKNPRETASLFKQKIQYSQLEQKGKAMERHLKRKHCEATGRDRASIWPNNAHGIFVAEPASPREVYRSSYWNPRTCPSFFLRESNGEGNFPTSVEGGEIKIRMWWLRSLLTADRLDIHQSWHSRQTIRRPTPPYAAHPSSFPHVSFLILRQPPLFLLTSVSPHLPQLPVPSTLCPGIQEIAASTTILTYIHNVTFSYLVCKAHLGNSHIGCAGPAVVCYWPIAGCATDI